MYHGPTPGSVTRVGRCRNPKLIPATGAISNVALQITVQIPYRYRNGNTRFTISHRQGCDAARLKNSPDIAKNSGIRKVCSIVLK